MNVPLEGVTQVANAVDVVSQRLADTHSADDENVTCLNAAFETAVDDASPAETAKAQKRGRDYDRQQNEGARYDLSMNKIQAACQQQACREACLQRHALLMKSIGNSHRLVEMITAADHDQPSYK